MKIGFIGVGSMGFPMAENILQDGFELFVNDINEEAVQKLVDKGAKKCDTPASLAESVDTVVIMLPNSKIVNMVFDGENGLLAGLNSDQVVINMSSIDPVSTKEFAEKAAELGVDWIDSPVSGGTSGAKEGTLTLMAGADSDVLENVRSVMEAMGNIKHVGNVGTGSGVKMINNLLLGVNMTAVAEAMVLGVKAGIEPETLFEIIGNSSGNSYAFSAKVPDFIMEGDFDDGFAIDLQYKDMQMAVDTAKELNVPLYTGNLSQQIYETAKAKGLGKKDISSVITMLEEMCDVEVRS
ncbi:MAG: NAD(P)-dependent oxidoreductase [Bacillota bacterium]